MRDLRDVGTAACRGGRHLGGGGERRAPQEAHRAGFLVLNARAARRTAGCTRARKAAWSTASARVAHPKTRCERECAANALPPDLIVKTHRRPPKVPPRHCPPHASESCPRGLRTTFRRLSEATPAQMPPCLSVGVARTCESSRGHVWAPRRLGAKRLLAAELLSMI